MAESLAKKDSALIIAMSEAPMLNLIVYLLVSHFKVSRHLAEPKHQVRAGCFIYFELNFAVSVIVCKQRWFQKYCTIIYFVIDSYDPVLSQYNVRMTERTTETEAF